MFINVKLRNNIVIISLPTMTRALQANYVPRTRTLSDNSTRTLSDGSNRTLDDGVFSYPEVTAIKLKRNMINVSVP